MTLSEHTENTQNSRHSADEPQAPSRTKKRLAVIAGAAVLVAGAGVAFAAYLSTGSGTASAQSSVAVSSTIAPGSNGTALYPGGSTDVTITISNPNPYPVRVTSISGGSSNATGTNGACTAGTVTSAAVTSPPTTVIAASGTGTYTLRASMIADPNNACQGQSYVLPLTAQLASAAS